MRHCDCKEPHERRRIVLTGGPGAGKTAILEVIRHFFCPHMKVLPEAAGIVFRGGFPRGGAAEHRKAVQRAIFFIQRELEHTAESEDPAIVICDRGTVDGVAYWPWPGTGEDLWASVGTTLEEQLARYDAVIHLRTPAAENGYNHENPLRIESAAEAVETDRKIAEAWSSHPRLTVIEATPDFISKAAKAVDALRAEMPECCRRHVVPLLGG